MLIANFSDASIKQFVAMAAAEKLAVLAAEDYFCSRTARADLTAFDRIMSRADGEPPREGDELSDSSPLYF